MVLDRIALMANHEQLPKVLRKFASQVGGISPGKNGSQPQCYDKKKWPEWADPGNTAYKAMVAELLKDARNSGKSFDTALLQTGYNNLLVMGAETTGDCVEAALGGAFAASRFFP